MTRRRVGPGFAYVAVVLWAGFAVSLAVWWLLFSLGQARQLAALGGEAERVGQVQRMLAWEGAVLLALPIGGGAALVIAIRRERARGREIQDFFTSFTHDLKTSLASLRLQVESLLEDRQSAVDSPHLDRLLKDTVRLELQLENSLFLAQASDGLLLESVPLQPILTHVAGDWPELTVDVQGDAVVRADRRALESVFRNVLQNATTHGEATAISVIVTRQGNAVHLEVADNGHGAPPGVVVPASRPFDRPTATSGTGIGLFVSQRLVRRMGGTLACRSEPDAGFTVAITLPEVT